ncbi:MAG TPA: elongation factor G, partial [Savagea sp.]
HQDASKETSGVIFKIRHDERGHRLAFARLLSGVVRLRGTITFRGERVKVTNLFVANGHEYTRVQEAQAGDVVVFLGLPSPEVGDTFGQAAIRITSPQAMMQAAVHIEDERPLPVIWSYFEQLGAEDPSLNISWDETNKVIMIHMLGLIQLETLQMTLRERFQLKVTFSEPQIIYRETINETVRGYGHFEPLKHYAEVHVELSPNEEGSGITYVDDTHPNDLTSGERMLIQEEVVRGTHYGTSIGAEWTDIHVRLIRAATHLRHTSPGDLQQATRRAIRQALEKVDMSILEPMYELHARIEAEHLGRLMSDIERGAGIAEPPTQEGTRIDLRARVPVANFASYPAQFASLTKGRGQLTLTPDGYTVCHNSESIIERSHYEPIHDTRTTSASIFCEKGAGYSVRGSEAEKMMHLLKEK